MANIDKNIINEIAQWLDCGNDCYFNPKTSEIVAIPNDQNITVEDEFNEIFSADLEKVSGPNKDYIKLVPLDSYESFKIMELFVEQAMDQ